jgi:hypothetical protein
MSKSVFKKDCPRPVQMTFDDIPRRVDRLLDEKQEIHRAMHSRHNRPRVHQEYFDEDCVELAAAVKVAIRESGMTRPALVDAVNRHYGWPTIAEAEAMETRHGDHLSLHMFNHYLSKPTEYRMPGALLFAVIRITGSLTPLAAMAECVGGDVVTRSEKDDLILGKAEQAAYELSQLTRRIKKGRR